MAQKKITLITPPMLLVWPKLNEPDVYRPKKGKPKIRYTTDAKPTKKSDLEKLQAFFKDCAKKLLPNIANPKLPFKVDKKTEELLLTASSGEKYRPPVFDAKNKKLPEDVIIGGGTLARLDLTVSEYEIDDGKSGINLYINAVQVLELHEGGFGKSRFDETDGFSYDGSSDEEQQSRFGGDDDSSAGEAEEEQDVGGAYKF